MPGLSPADVAPQAGGRRRSGASVKTLKKVLKKAGLKTSGKKAALTRRAKKARLMRGGMAKPVEEVVKGGAAEVALGEEMDGARRRRKSRGSKKFLGVF